MVWIHSVTEYSVARYADDVMNPMSPERLLRLGRRLRLAPGQRVLDIGAGRCGPSRLLAAAFGCHVTAVEPHEEFLDGARQAVAEAGLSEQFTFVQAQGADFEIEPAAFDAAFCLGATWAWGGLEGTIAALTAGVGDGGHVVAGEPYRLSAEDPVRYAPHGHTLPGILSTFESAGLCVVAVMRSTTDEWDDYHAVHAASMLDWLEDHPGHPDTEQVRQWRREHALGIIDHDIGWAVVAGRRASVA